jgi:hypothetical protein
VRETVEAEPEGQMKVKGSEKKGKVAEKGDR